MKADKDAELCERFWNGWRCENWPTLIWEHPTGYWFVWGGWDHPLERVTEGEIAKLEAAGAVRRVPYVASRLYVCQDIGTGELVDIPSHDQECLFIYGPRGRVACRLAWHSDGGGQNDGTQ